MSAISEAEDEESTYNTFLFSPLPQASPTSASMQRRHFWSPRRQAVRKSALADQLRKLTAAEATEKPLHRFANLCRPPSIMEIFQKQRFKALRYLWTGLMALLWILLIYAVSDITKDYFAENTGTRMATEQLDIDFVQRYFKFTVCPRDWISSQKLTQLNISKEEMRYLMGYISDIYTDTMTEQEVLRARQKVRQWIRNSTELMQFFRSIMYDFGVQGIENASIFFPYNGPAYSGLCFTIPAIKLMYAPMGNFMQADFQYIQFDPNNTIDQYFYINDTGSFFYFHYSGEQMAAITSGLHNVYFFQYEMWHYYVRLKHYHNHNSINKPCIPNEGHDFLPLGYARDLCALNCTDTDGFILRFNCSILPFYNPTAANNSYEQCNYLDPELNWTTGHSRFSLLASVQGECIKKCSERRFCHEWDIERTVLHHSPTRCADLPRQRCNKVSFYGWIDSRAELLSEYPLRNWNTVLADYGGQLGLFVGVSLSSVVHLFVHWCSLCAKQKEKKRRNKADQVISLNGIRGAPLRDSGDQTVVGSKPMVLEPPILAEEGTKV